MTIGYFKFGKHIYEIDVHELRSVYNRDTIINPNMALYRTNDFKIISIKSLNGTKNGKLSKELCGRPYIEFYLSKKQAIHQDYHNNPIHYKQITDQICLYTAEGKLRTKFHIINGLIHGNYYEYDFTNKICIQKYYINGCIEGIYKKTYSTSQFINNNQHGNCIMYEYFADLFDDPDHVTHKMTEYRNNVKHGKKITYKRDGNVAETT